MGPTIYMFWMLKSANTNEKLKKLCVGGTVYYVHGVGKSQQIMYGPESWPLDMTQFQSPNRIVCSFVLNFLWKTTGTKFKKKKKLVESVLFYGLLRSSDRKGSTFTGQIKRKSTNGKLYTCAQLTFN